MRTLNRKKLGGGGINFANFRMDHPMIDAHMTSIKRVDSEKNIHDDWETVWCAF